MIYEKSATLKFSYKKILENYSCLAFFLLFPGFFIYHTLVGLGILPPFLGGFFGVVSISLFPLFIILFFKVHGFKNTNYCRFDMIFYLILILILFTSVINYFFDKPENYVSEMLVWSMSGVLFMANNYLIARTIPFHSNFFRIILFISLLLTALIVFFNIGPYGIFDLRSNFVNIDSVASYQGFARSLVVVSFLLLILFKDKRLNLLVFTVSSVALFFNGARTELVLFIFSSVVTLLYFNFLSIKKMFLSLLSFFLILICTILFYHELLKILPDNRILQLLDISLSSSYKARVEIFENGMNLIKNSPLIGDYGGYTVMGGIGFYPHNVLSAWVNIGFFGFSLYLISFFLIAFTLLVGINNKYRNYSEMKALLLFSVFTISALILSKDYSYMLVGLMFGFCSRFLVSKAFTVKCDNDQGVK